MNLYLVQYYDFVQNCWLDLELVSGAATVMELFRHMREGLPDLMVRYVKEK